MWHVASGRLYMFLPTARANKAREQSAMGPRFNVRWIWKFSWPRLFGKMFFPLTEVYFLGFSLDIKEGTRDTHKA